jgi:hypothetical protein
LGPSEKPSQLISHTVLKQLILLIATIGCFLCLYGFFGAVRWCVYISIGFVVAGYLFTLMQLIRLEQYEWLSSIIFGSAIFFPAILVMGIIYGVRGPTNAPSKPTISSKRLKSKPTNSLQSPKRKGTKTDTK